MENSIEFGNTLREERKKRKLTLTDMSKRSGVSTPYISRVERGLFKPTIDMASRLLGVFGQELKVVSHAVQ